MITNITDRERTQAAVIQALESARDEMSARIEALTAELAQAYADSRQTVDDAAAVARENTALRAELAEARLQYVATFGQEQNRGWTSVDQDMPKSGQTVLACYKNSAGNWRRIRAEWIAAKTSESGPESDIGEFSHHLKD